MATSRRGRPYLVPDDRTPLGDTAVDVNARVGWLLLMSRLHHPDPEFSQGEAFNAALRAVGLQADRSAVSRWESGKVTPRYSVLVAYERVLNLRPGQLTSVVNAQRRAFGGGGLPTWMPVLDPSSTAFHQELDALLDSLLDGNTTGDGWISLAHHVACAESIFVQRKVWRTLARTLLSQMARGVGVAYLQRFEAVRLLLENCAGQSWLITATIDYLSDPAVQIVSDPVALLEMATSEEAAEAALDLCLHSHSPLVRRAALPVVASKLDAGAYPPGTVDDVHKGLAEALREVGGTENEIAELWQLFPEPVRSRLATEFPRSSRARWTVDSRGIPAFRFPAEITLRTSERLAHAVQGRLRAAHLYDTDKMTPRLIREAIFAARPVLNHYASLALLGSPLRSALADELVDEIDRRGVDDPLCGPYARVLRYLAGVSHEAQLLEWLTTAPPEVARDLALTLGHLPGCRSLGVVLTMLGEEPALDRALIYALGMRQAPELTTLAADTERPTAHREAARWWLRQGGAVTR